jgi:hypothetical protein
MVWQLRWGPRVLQQYVITGDMAAMMAQANAQARTAGGAARGSVPGGFGGPRTDASTKNAKEYVASKVKHECLNGFKLPDMPA